MSAPVYRRCGCKDADGKQLGSKCPKLSQDPKHGSWSYLLSAGSDPRTKRRRQYRKSGFRTKKAAESALAKLRTELDQGTYKEPTTTILAEYAPAVLARRQVTGSGHLAEYAPAVLARRQVTGSGLKPNTVAMNGRYVQNDIVPSRLGEMLLTDIRRSHVNAWIRELSDKGRGAVTVRRALATLRMILSTAVRDELIPSNPALMADQPTVGDGRPKHWDLEQISAFLERCGHHRLGPLFEVAVLTGLRRGEICGLHWSDVDLVKRQIVVRHNRVSVDGRIQESTTKTRAGLRTVPLSDAATAALLTWQLRQAQEREAAQEAWIGDGHVFTMEDGRPLNPSSVTRTFEAIRTDDPELPPLTFHGLRHSAASLMLAGKADIAVVSKLLGHSSISITADVYSDLIGSIGQQAVDGAASLLAHKVHTPEIASTDVG